MKRSFTCLLMLTLPVMAGCAQKPAETAAGTTETPAAVEAAAAAPAAAELLAKSLYDDGARAVEGTVDATSAAAGEKLFATKGCVACHGYGKKLTGPDLKGVTTRRTAAWLEQQIMHPDVMTRTDPISHALMVENKGLQMINLHLTLPEAQSLVEHFKKLDHAK